jgi:hypothetical protein
LLDGPPRPRGGSIHSNLPSKKVRQALSEATQIYYKTYGKFAGVGGATLNAWTNNTYDYWDRRVLMSECLIESALRTRFATNAYVRVARITTTNTTIPILSYGNLGSLWGFNGNNGLYNLTQEYTALNLPPGECTMWASRRLGQALGMASFVVSPAARDLTCLAMSIGPEPLTALCGKRARNRNFNWLGRLWSFPLRGLSKRSTTSGGQFPAEVCYPLPYGTPAPGTDIGYTVSIPNPMFPNPNAKTQIVAPSSKLPAYVVEVVLQGVTVENAYRLSRAIDGVRQSNWAYYDSLGRVKYDMYDASGGSKRGVVFIYLGHK